MKRTLQLLIALVLFGNISRGQKPTLLASGPLIEEGIALHDKGEFKQAIELYKKVNRNDTNYVRALYELGVSYTADSQYNKAMEAYQEGLYGEDDREREPDFYNSYGSLLDNMNKSEWAISVLDSGIAKYPAYSSLYLNKGITLLKMEKLDEAEELFKKVLVIDPYSHSSHYLLGQIALQKGKIVQAFISTFSYLMMNPSGRYFQKSINTLSLIASYKDGLRDIIDKRKETPSDSYQSLEEILLSKIALDKNYKALVKIDDPICRQIQVLLEKIEYVEDDKDFWMQYYVPMYKAMFANKRFEPFINHIFSNVDIASIKEYNKKNKKENEALINEIVGYLNDIRITRELNYSTRSKSKIIYSFDEGKLSGKGPVSDDGKLAIGEWNYYYRYGNNRSKGAYNDKGEKIGKWHYYSFDQKLEAFENFKEGKVEGEVEHYFHNGNLSSKSTYKNDELDGLRTTYYLPGSLRTTENYKMGKLDGQKKAYFNNGTIHFVETYRSDSLHGPYESYYNNGQLEYKTVYTAGKLEGAINGWHENGQKDFEGQYVNNELDGEWKRYYETGALKNIEHYIKGVLEGDYTEYHENGKLYYKSFYKKGKTTGEVLYFDEDEKLFSKFIFKNDLLTEAFYYDKTGKEISHSTAKNKKINLITFDTKGFKTSDINYNEKGVAEGTETKFFKSGRTSSVNQYANGELNGTSIDYYVNGKKSSEVNLVDKKKEGYVSTYHQNGKLKSEGWYRDNEAQGDWKFYNIMGDLTVENHYEDDDLHKFHVEYWPNGKKESETENQYGWIKTYKQYDTIGNLINSINLAKGTGVFTEKHLNGKNKSLGQYLQGTFHGPYTFYFFDGTVETAMHYQHGLLDSSYKNYHFGGTLHIEGQYKMGQKTGTWKTYYSRGKLQIVEQYTHGLLNGKKTYYYENGKVDTEISFENGIRKGTSSKFNESGELAYVLYYDADEIIGYGYHDKSGKLLPMIQVPGGTGKIKTYFSNGAVSSVFEYIDGVLTGKNQLYHSNGKLEYESQEEFGFTQGQSKEFFSNGQLKELYTYVDNNLHGAYSVYNEKGQKIREGVYYDDDLHGMQQYYDETTGKLRETRIYYFGTLISVKK